MKAYLLAAGLGTRLRPITDTIPKCLVPINDRPLLGYWLDLLEQHGVSDVLLNLHHLPDPVREYVREYDGPVHVELVMEPRLLGSAGTLHANRDFVRDEEQFHILYADNLTSVDLTELRGFNSAHPAPLTVGLFHAENPSACGIVELDREGAIIDCEEKPASPKSDLASAGLFVARQELFDHIAPNRTPYDLGGDVMPTLIGRMNGMMVNGYLRDVGTHENLLRAEREWRGMDRHARS